MGFVAYPNVPLIASGGKSNDSMRETIAAGANAITCAPPSTQELFKQIMRFQIHPRVYLKTENVTGSEEFSRCARHFFAGILTYFKEK